jgi:malonyl-CoA/methylmalonyl-CoA synthetase
MLADRLTVQAAALGPAIVDDRGATSYRQLDQRASCVAAALGRGGHDLGDVRVAFLMVPGATWVATLFGIWRAGGMAVPLALSHPAAELDYVIRDAGVSIVVADESLRGRVAPTADAVGAWCVRPDELDGGVGTTTPAIGPDRPALMLYTSGTTGKPKGVVTTHANLTAQTHALVDAWGWSSDDRTLLVLPLHHVHGLINVVASALWSGAVCEMAARFDAEATWTRLASGRITVFTAVPTIYYRLIDAWERAPERQAARSAGARKSRLMMSGSAALPVGILERWRTITGHTLLERYGMTEVGMALSNPLDGERRPGLVGTPLPGVHVRLVDEHGEAVPAETAGEVEVRGPGVFREYWRRPEETRAAFRDGWFRTGDVAVLDRDAYRLLGRASVDIIKTGGFKVSALEIEDTLRQHPAVGDCAVVGLDDPEWGQRLCAAVELRSGADESPDALLGWLAERLAPYKQPRRVRIVEALPRNVMGKVVKPEIAAWFDAGGAE